MHHINDTRKRAHSLGILMLGAAFVAAGACPSKRAANGTVDTTVLETSFAVDAEGPGVHVTRTDAKSVDKSTEYKLTEENFKAFVAAADSLNALANRDSVARNYLASDLTDAGAKTTDAGLNWLESNAPVNNAINSAGISTRDYFVQGIAIASAERFVKDPNAAPPTPTAKSNAEFLRGHQAELTHLQSLRSGKPVVVSKP